MAVKIDKTDLKILKMLQEDGRITNLQLSNEVNLSPAPTLERVRKLEKHGIIKSYHADVDEDKMGMGIKAIIQVSLVRQLDNALQNFKKQIMEIDEVVECLQVTGAFDYQLRVIVKDIPAFDKLITEQLSKVEEIGQMQTYVVLSTVKKSNVLPLNY
ncbi:MAG: Lrp/AsnC family transcriptional regulator [Flavobacteriales bacterium]|nr:Lrp/AsnC family transcriptional regulator [Flavobacteriales bacterium]